MRDSAFVPYGISLRAPNTTHTHFWYPFYLFIFVILLKMLLQLTAAVWATRLSALHRNTAHIGLDFGFMLSVQTLNFFLSFLFLISYGSAHVEMYVLLPTQLRRYMFMYCGWACVWAVVVPTFCRCSIRRCVAHSFSFSTYDTLKAYNALRLFFDDPEHIWISLLCRVLDIGAVSVFS